jgi:hypothetical protein
VGLLQDALGQWVDGAIGMNRVVIDLGLLGAKVAQHIITGALVQFKIEQINWQYGQHNMKKELVLVRDLQGYWSCVFCVTCTEGKQISDAEHAIELIRNEYPDLKTAHFVEEGIEIFALVSEEFAMINSGERCK